MYLFDYCEILYIFFPFLFYINMTKYKVVPKNIQNELNINEILCILKEVKEDIKEIKKELESIKEQINNRIEPVEDLPSDNDSNIDDFKKCMKTINSYEYIE